MVRRDNTAFRYHPHIKITVNMEKIIIELIIERGNDDLSGRVTYNNNLIVNNGKTVQELGENMKVLLQDFEDVDPNSIEFEILPIIVE